MRGNQRANRLTAVIDDYGCDQHDVRSAGAPKCISERNDWFTLQHPWTSDAYAITDSRSKCAELCWRGACLLGIGQGDRAHGAQFDVTTGAVLAPPAPAPVSGYRLRVDHDDIIVEI
jgi:hypothetical protein